MRKTSMLNYAKNVLKRVSFDKRLFRKEYKKSLGWLTKHEAKELKNWIRNSNGAFVEEEIGKQESYLFNKEKY